MRRDDDARRLATPGGDIRGARAARRAAGRWALGLALVTAAGCGGESEAGAAGESAAAATAPESGAGAAGTLAPAGGTAAGPPSTGAGAATGGGAAGAIDPGSGGAPAGGVGAPAPGTEPAASAASAGMPGTGSIPATFDTLRSVIQQAPCFGAGCHNDDQNPLDLRLNEELHARVTSRISESCGGIPVVSPGDPEGSALVQLLRGPCGETPRMPIGCVTDGDASCVPPDYMAAIEQWIAAGAPEL